MSKKKFARENKRFWSKFKEPYSDNFLLVETSAHPVMNHANAVVGKMVAKAKNLRIAWIKYPHTNEALMRSYSTNSLFLKFTKLSYLTKILFIMLSCYYYLYYVLLTNKLLSFKIKEIPYGDFVYDGYLAHNKMATLHRFDPKIVLIFFKLLLNDEKVRLILHRYPIKAVLISHHIGLETGPLTRVALQMKIPVYWKGGGHEIINLAVFKSLKQIYNYPKKPSLQTINLLAKKYQTKVESDFNKFIRNSLKSSQYDSLSVAYNNQISSNINRKTFLKRMKFDDRPNVFVMLHAFNDHPHSHFEKMLFNDYYDWFIQTLKFVQKEKSKNWIFKEHPANKFYPTKDLNLKKMMKNLPKHIKFVSQYSDIKASVVLNVADMIVTCLGTAGIEMPALKAIPSIVTSDTFYDGFGFTIEPKSKTEYFSILKKVRLKPLSPQQQLRAKSCYTYLEKYCAMPFDAGPSITFKENKNPQMLGDVYPKRILKAYENKSKVISRQFNEYVQEIRKNNFQCLNRISDTK